MIRFKAAVEEPGSKLSITQPQNVPSWKQGLIELCINPDGSFNAELYRLAFTPGISVGDFHDICEVVISHRDYVDAYRQFVASSSESAQTGQKKNEPAERNNVDALIQMARDMGAREIDREGSTFHALSSRREHG